MKCASCNNEINNGAKFCKFCGAPVPATIKATNPVEKKCSRCHQIVPSTAKFCKFCGTRVSASDAICPECGKHLIYGGSFHDT